MSQVLDKQEEVNEQEEVEKKERPKRNIRKRKRKMPKTDTNEISEVQLATSDKPVVYRRWFTSPNSFIEYLPALIAANKTPERVQFKIHEKKGWLVRRGMKKKTNIWNGWERCCGHGKPLNICCGIRDVEREQFTPTFIAQVDPTKNLTPEEKRITKIQHICGFLGGDGSISVLVRKDGSLQFRVEIYQSRKDILDSLQKDFGGQVVREKQWRDYLEEDNNKYTHYKTPYKLLWSAAEREGIINTLLPHMILKYDQLKRASELLPYLHDSSKEAQNIRTMMAREISSMKSRWKTGVLPELPFDRLCDPYVAGLFDAEGCVQVYRQKNIEKDRIAIFGAEIAQKSNVQILEKITEMYGGRVTSSNMKWRVDMKNAHVFLSKIRFYTREAKRAQIEAFLECYELYINPKTKNPAWKRIKELIKIIAAEKRVD